MFNHKETTMSNDTEITKFINEFAKHGVLFTQDEVEAVFFWHTKKIHNLIGELTDENGN